MSIQHKQKCIEVALGNVKADLVIKNGNIINVFTKEIIQGDIAILDDMIVGIGQYEGIEEIDASGKYVCPGLIDSHMHIESSMVTPVEFARNVVPHGTTTIVADPHEIANVCGTRGIDFMLNNSENLPMNMFFMMPSCVPATSFENNGAVLTAECMKPYVNNPRILGLGEVMDFHAVLSGEQAVLQKIALFDDAVIDGHSSNLSIQELCAYSAMGIMTNHECVDIDEVINHLRLGMYVQIREGSGAKNLETILTGLLRAGMPFDRCLFCTDDKHLEDIRQEGHISHNIRKAIKCGLSAIEAIRMATINAAECYKLERLGAVAPGYFADILILSELEDFSVEKVLFRGKLVSENGSKPIINNLLQGNSVFDTVRLPNVTIQDLQIKLTGSNAAVITLSPHQLITRKESLVVKKDEQGLFAADDQFSKAAVVERHKATGNIGLAIIKGFNIKDGAIASTVAHDSHNLIVIGDNDQDMLAAIRELERVKGGLTIVSKGKVLDTLALPIAGLISNEDGDYVEHKLSNMLARARSLNINTDIDPFITMSFLSLPVIPEIRVTDKGLFDVTKFKFIHI